jgi:hypothetical protein
VALSDLLRNPFGFLFARSRSEEGLVAYVIREHDRGRSLTDILDDPYVRNRSTPEERNRLLDHPEVVKAVGDDMVDAARG